MYRHFPIPTDGSELAQHAVSHGLALAKAVGAKASALVAEHSFNVFNVPESKIYSMPKEFAAYNSAGVACEAIQLVHDQPYEGIIKPANEKSCDLIVMASHDRGGYPHSCLVT